MLYRCSAGKGEVLEGSDKFRILREGIKVFKVDQARKLGGTDILNELFEVYCSWHVAEQWNV